MSCRWPQVLIPFEDLHDVDDIMHLCEGIYIARYHSPAPHSHRRSCMDARLRTHVCRYMAQHMSEESLYRRLIHIFRTPPLLRRLTRRKDD